MSTPTKVRRHAFDPDESLADSWDNTRRAERGLPQQMWCRQCGLPGEPGDHRHTTITAEEIARAWRDWDAARTGERD